MRERRPKSDLLWPNSKFGSGLLSFLDTLDDTVGVWLVVESPLVEAAGSNRNEMSHRCSKGGEDVVYVQISVDQICRGHNYCTKLKIRTICVEGKGRDRGRVTFRHAP